MYLLQSTMRDANYTPLPKWSIWCPQAHQWGKHVASVPEVPQGNVVAEVYTCGLVKTDMCSFRFTSVYRAEAMVASGVLPWQLISSSSRANLQAYTESLISFIV